MDQIDEETLWENFIQELSPSIGPKEKGFLSLCKLIVDFQSGQVILLVPNEFIKNHVEQNYKNNFIIFLSKLNVPLQSFTTVIDSTLTSTTTNVDTFDQPDISPQTLQSSINSSNTNSSVNNKPNFDFEEFNLNDMATNPKIGANFTDESISTENTTEKSVSTLPNTVKEFKYYDEKSHLNPKYTFETFVTGPTNNFAHAAAISVAENPGIEYNPLFIYGGSGLGKTHLLHAMGNLMCRLNPEYEVRYVTSEEFTNEFVSAIRNDSRLKFSEKYRKVDILLIDDIQFLKGKEGTLEEFFNTFNTLYNANKQIVLTSDVHPKDLKNLEDRLVSRFKSGIICDIQSPNMEIRRAILESKTEREGITLPSEVITFIASVVTTNIRELEGALTQILAYSSLYKTEITLDAAKEILKELTNDVSTVPLSLEQIIELTADHFNITVEQMHSNSRSKKICFPRQIAMYLCRTFTSYSLPVIGEAFGKDHTTIMHATDKMKKLVKQESEAYFHITALSSQINKNRFS